MPALIDLDFVHVWKKLGAQRFFCMARIPSKVGPSGRFPSRQVPMYGITLPAFRRLDLPSPAELLFPVLHSLCFGDQNSTAEGRPGHPCERFIFVSQILLRRSR
jgi:hypothetical protein